MKTIAKIRARRFVEDVCGESVAMDLIDAPRRLGADVSVSASIMHVGKKPSAVVDISISTESPERLRELGAWLSGVADFLGEATL